MAAHFRKELMKIADLCKKHNVLCVSDEVYEWMVYDGNEHVRMGKYSEPLALSPRKTLTNKWNLFPIATLPGMWERTLTCGSAGKTFSVTGWKTGWAYGPANLMTNLQMVC